MTVKFGRKKRSFETLKYNERGKEKGGNVPSLILRIVT